VYSVNVSYDGAPRGPVARMSFASSRPGQSAVYTPSARPREGTIAIAGKSIAFTGLEPVDFIGGTLTLTCRVRGCRDPRQWTLTDNVTPAVVISGTSGGVGFENIRLQTSALNIDTTTVAGVDRSPSSRQASAAIRTSPSIPAATPATSSR